MHNFWLKCIVSVSYKKKIKKFHYYADSGLPTGSSDDISRIHGGWDGVGVVNHTCVVFVVLLHGPDGGVLNGLLLFQLQGTKKSAVFLYECLVEDPSKVNMTMVPGGATKQNKAGQISYPL